MRNYATNQQIGLRRNQCDATAVFTDRRTGARAYVLLDGIGDTNTVREWTRDAAVRLARAAARRGDAELGLRAVYDGYVAQGGGRASAVAVVAVTAPGKPLTVAWCGDSRAYLLIDGTAQRLTNDHNLRRLYTGGSRNTVTSWLGSAFTEDEVKERCEGEHPAIESVTRPASTVRLLLASDGAYEPHEDAQKNLGDLLTGTPGEVARRLTTTAVQQSITATRTQRRPEGYADNATVLVADLNA
ncbi:mucin-2 [Streptomyces sp. NBC_01304]|uniref:mucin-2 n=1 Tax=Streptomyces sp. NBC_01304 TaxID=2903818 RepID=UPI002E0E1086|nr:mucin-2 [Streptomyces sp. NBC_01304]